MALGVVIHDRYLPSDTSYSSMPHFCWLPDYQFRLRAKSFMASPVFSKDSDWTNFNQTAFVDPSAAASWLSQSSIIPTNISLINESLLEMQQLWIQMDAKVLLMIMKRTIFSSHH